MLPARADAYSLRVQDDNIAAACTRSLSFSEDAMSAELRCQQLQMLVHDALAKHMYESAVFFADKLVSMLGNSPLDVYTLAQVRMHLTRTATDRSCDQS